MKKKWFKITNHMVEGLLKLNTLLPLQLWDHLLLQRKLALNLLRTLIFHPHILEHTYMYGAVDYQATPNIMGPTLRVRVFIKARTRKIHMTQDINHKNKQNQSEKHSIILPCTQLNVKKYYSYVAMKKLNKLTQELINPVP